MANEAKGDQQATSMVGDRQKTKKKRRTRRATAAKNSKATWQAVAKTYVPTPEERDVAEGHFARQKEKPPVPRLIAGKNGGVVEIGPDHPDPQVGMVLIMQALGITDTAFLDGILWQLVNAGSHSEGVDERRVNFMLSAVKGVEPKDEVEVMLAAQMAVVHAATMTMARRLALVETIPQQDSAERGLNKLARTFTAQVEALKKYRTGGEQNVTVKHVTVNQGGQAIVGNVERSPGSATSRGHVGTVTASASSRARSSRPLGAWPPCCRLCTLAWSRAGRGRRRRDAPRTHRPRQAAGLSGRVEPVVGTPATVVVMTRPAPVAPAGVRAMAGARVRHNFCDGSVMR